MPNWCMTTYNFHGNREEITVFQKKLIEWTSKEFTKTDFNQSWLGNVLYGCGLEDRIDNSDKNLEIRCRGTISDIGDISECNDGSYSFSLYAETAWVPMAKIWIEAIKKLGLRSIRFAYQAEEPGCEIFTTYDPYSLGDFSNEQVYIDICYDGHDKDLTEAAETLYGYYTKDYAVKILNDFFGTEDKTLDELSQIAEEFADQHENLYMGIHEFEEQNEIYD